MSDKILPPGATWITPYIVVSNVDDMIKFYEKAFAFKTTEKSPGEDGSTWHAELKYQNQMLMMGKAGAYGGTIYPPTKTGSESPINLYLYCQDVDNFYRNATQHGAISLAAPEDMFWGDRMCRLKDPDGYIWCFATFSGQRK